MIRAVDKHADLLCEFTVPVRQHEGLFDISRLGSLEHNDGVVDGEAYDPVDAQRREVVVKKRVAREVAVRTGRSERTRQGKQNDPFVREHIRRDRRLPSKRVVTAQRRVAYANMEHSLGHKLRLHCLPLRLRTSP